MPTTTARPREFKARLLRNEREYDAAVAEITRLFDKQPKPGSPNDQRLQFLSVLVAAYDDEHYPMQPETTPQQVVDFMLEQHDMKRADLAELLGGRSRVSDFFSGKRELSIGQIRTLREHLEIPADLLIA